MSIDALQEKIRKTKNPSVLYFDGVTDWIPPHIRAAEENDAAAYGTFCRSLLAELKGIVPAVRFSFGGISLLGTDLLSALLKEADRLGYYVLLDAPEMLNTQSAKYMVTALCDKGYFFDGLIVPSYLGTDILKPFLPLCKEGKTLFPVVRTANKSAAEVQDLITGGRLVHTAVADLVNRLGEQLIGKSGYSSVGAVASASGQTACVPCVPSTPDCSCCWMAMTIPTPMPKIAALPSISWVTARWPAPVSLFCMPGRRQKGRTTCLLPGKLPSV